MESFAKLKRRGTDLLNSLPHNLPQMPQMPQLPHRASHGAPTMKGTWQHVAVPPLPRSSHSLDVVAGNAYIFGGEVEARKPVDNDMHVIALPSSGAPADYYAVKARPSPKQPSSADTKQHPAPISEEDETEAQLKDPLSDVPLASPPPVGAGAYAESEPASATSDKGKSVAGNDSSSSSVPCARVGHASAVIGSRIFIFGGRASSSSSSPLDEGGRVWVFETKTHTWTALDPWTGSPVPAARSYFAAAATDKPRDFAIKPLRRAASWKEWAEGDSAAVGIPQRPVAGSVAESAADEEDAGFGTFLIHGGCVADGGRTADVWAFDVRSRTWKELPSAPGPARGGAALAFAKGRLYRFGGFDGAAELGGQLDVLELALDGFDDRVSRGEVGIFAKGEWQSVVAPVTAAPATAPSDHTIDETAKLVPVADWPANRSVASLELVLGGGGREYLVLMLGERTPSNDGHAAAGSFHNDIWTFQVPPEGMSAASFRDAVFQAVGRKTGEGKWTRVAAHPYDDEDALDARGPGARGWLASAPLGDLEENAILVFGGLNENNERLGDGWIFRLD
ncbi:hypothetical protein F4821DRAFT_225394 [Hypoxylon rubiginosum]|uniref:Uncharacterized protein n=1 Tax=Hypoxylon rubiginosum TaxID=110542 RepID=A0ACC0DHK4_9PEZI|nr:hypothetical protein F4821DRAFT_225394 [Hypoxylon rubiginosum]